jgi:hypothetical protein
MNKENINKVMQELNKMLGNLQADEYPTTETDSAIKGIKKVLKIMNPSPAPAKKIVPAKKTSKSNQSKKPINKTTKKAVKKTVKK